MAIDFKKKLASRTITPKTNPIELYGTLDRKSALLVLFAQHRKLFYLSGIQNDVQIRI